MEIDKLWQERRSLFFLVAIDPSFSLLFNNRGLIYYKMGRNGKSISDFLQAIKLDSSQSIYYANIALPFFDKEEYQMGCIDLKKASSMGLNIESMGQIGERISQNCNF